MSKEICQSQDCKINSECLVAKWIRCVNPTSTDARQALGQIDYLSQKGLDRDCPNEAIIRSEAKKITQRILQEALPR